MENLSELVRRILRERGDKQDDFADRLGIKRQHLSNWTRTLPAAGTLRAIAADLDLPYGQVLAAALRSGGLIENVSDVLAGLSVRVVFRDDATNYDEDDDEPPVAVYSTDEAAAEYQRVSNAVSEGRYESVAVQVDAVAPPEHVVVYSTVWERIDGIEQSELLYSKVPVELSDRNVTDVRAGVLSEPYGVFELRTLSLDMATGRAAIEKALAAIVAADRLLPPDIPVPSFMQRAFALEQEYHAADLAAAANKFGRPPGFIPVPPPLRIQPPLNTEVVEAARQNLGRSYRYGAGYIGSAGIGGLGPMSAPPPTDPASSPAQWSDIAANWDERGGLMATNFFGINTEPLAVNEQRYVGQWIPPVRYITIRQESGDDE
ncbi:PPE family protein [Mycobacteroides abscessus subsp. abscessus]|uniref:helix-turn-helix domain-containing protein n=1 Tax=Mycobacteroides abscessus TaxID=36809 RepID=UPI0009281837|nr:helix-turn-helix transcriptional regulator [Mycobacteroides abscessus]SHY53716.1 PPE family protein [Mycobacteroides abscessus subsp. abscessus]